MTPRIMTRAVARDWLTSTLNMPPRIAGEILAAAVPVCRIRGVPMYLRADVEQALEEHIASGLPQQRGAPS